MQENISLEKAQQMITGAVKPLTLERIPLAQALGRVLGRDFFAPGELPTFDCSPLDGYALRGEDTSEATRDCPVTLKILEEVPAGYAGRFTVQPGTAVQICTGAPIPPGADAVIRQEDTTLTGDLVQIEKPVTPGSNICYAGEDIAYGEKVLSAGQRIDPAETGVLAALGVTGVAVYRKPVLALFSTGDELVDITTKILKPGKIRNSNIYTQAVKCTII